MSWEVIIPFLRPLEPLLADPEVTDILVNGASSVFVEKEGRMQEVSCPELTEKSLQVAVRNIARVLNDEVGPEKPILDARLPDGSRVAAILPPASISGTVLAIRKFHGQRYNADELVRLGTLTPEVRERLQKAVSSRENILISGSTGSGKTTLSNALAGFIPPEERIIVIEDTCEIQVNHKHLVRLEARREQPPVPAVTIRDLLKATLRLKPDRIILGEVRGGEAFDLLQLLNTGHSGTLVTLHANSAGHALGRLTTCVLQSGVELPYRAVRSSIADTVNLLVHMGRRHGQRLVTQLFAVRGYDAALDRYELERLYERD